MTRRGLRSSPRPPSLPSLRRRRRRRQRREKRRARVGGAAEGRGRSEKEGAREARRRARLALRLRTPHGRTADCLSALSRSLLSSLSRFPPSLFPFARELPLGRQRDRKVWDEISRGLDRRGKESARGAPLLGCLLFFFPPRTRIRACQTPPPLDVSSNGDYASSPPRSFQSGVTAALSNQNRDDSDNPSRAGK